MCAIIYKVDQLLPMNNAETNLTFQYIYQGVKLVRQCKGQWGQA
jgi:hypothetical protein